MSFRIKQYVLSFTLVCCVLCELLESVLALECCMSWGVVEGRGESKGRVGLKGNVMRFSHMGNYGDFISGETAQFYSSFRNLGYLEHHAPQGRSNWRRYTPDPNLSYLLPRKNTKERRFLKKNKKNLRNF